MSKAQSEELNGLHPAKIKEIVESLKNPEVLKAVSGPWRARVQWQGGFRAKAYMRTHTIELDEPAGLDATDLAASAHEYILSAVGGCMMVGFVLNATKKGIKIHDLENTGDHELVFTTVEFLKSANPPLAVPDKVRLTAA